MHSQADTCALRVLVRGTALLPVYGGQHRWSQAETERSAKHCPWIVQHMMLCQRMYLTCRGLHLAQHGRCIPRTGAGLTGRAVLLRGCRALAMSVPSCKLAALAAQVIQGVWALQGCALLQTGQQRTFGSTGGAGHSGRLGPAGLRTPADRAAKNFRQLFGAHTMMVSNLHIPLVQIIQSILQSCSALGAAVHSELQDGKEPLAVLCEHDAFASHLKSYLVKRSQHSGCVASWQVSCWHKRRQPLC